MMDPLTDILRSTYLDGFCCRWAEEFGLLQETTGYNILSTGYAIDTQVYPSAIFSEESHQMDTWWTENRIITGSGLLITEIQQTNRFGSRTTKRIRAIFRGDHISYCPRGRSKRDQEAKCMHGFRMIERSQQDPKISCTRSSIRKKVKIRN